MCGICGLVSAGAESTDEYLQRMNQMIVHRGPDADGAVVAGRVGLAMRRLAIIDVRGGNQPIYNESGSVAVVLNGEIYNFRDLVAELEGLGHVFRTRSDTEAVVHAYEEWGDACAQRLRGMFALAVLDLRRGAAQPRLFLARDHLGVKPLYYWQAADSFIFASEVRAVLASGLVPRDLDLDGVIAYLRFGSVQEPLTLVRGVRSLPPGHTLVWDGGHLQVNRYWALPSPSEVRVGVPMEQLYAEVGERLRSAVGSQLVADVPLGTFLSGGIDSAAIAALMREAGVGAVKSFSLVFDEAAYDEREYSRLAAAHIGTDHTEIKVTGAQVRGALPHAMSSFDQPSVDGLNTYFVSKAVREAGLTVALSGVGGDELFGGYGGHDLALRATRAGQLLRRVPRAVRSVLALLADTGVTERTRKMADLLRCEEHPYFLTRQLFGPRQVRRLLAPGLPTAAPSAATERMAAMTAETRQHDPLNAVAALEVQTYMLSTLLRDTDQMSMAHSLEVRVPLLDHELVETLFRIPGDLKVAKGQPKPLLTLPLRGKIPDGCVHRPKRGFELPIAAWLRDDLMPHMEASFLGQSETNAHPFSASALTELWRGFQAGWIGWSRVWAVFVLRHWLGEHRVSGGADRLTRMTGAERRGADGD